MGVSTEFGERLKFLDFSEGVWHSSGLPVVKIDLKKRYGFHGFKVFSASGNENKRGITSFIMKFFNESINFVESVVDVLKIVMSVNDFFFDKFSVGDGSIVNTSVSVHDGCEITNFFTTSVFFVVVLNFKVSSFIEGRLFKTVKNVHDSINSISGLFLQLKEFNHLVIDEFGLADS